MTGKDDGGTVPWRDFLAEATRRFEEAGVGEPVISGRRIVEEASGHSSAELSLYLNEPATTRGVAYFDSMVARRLQGEPIQYVVGRWGFRTLDLFIDRRVLIPRPETEEVAGHAIEEARNRLLYEDRVLVADLGTGSGAIGLSLAVEVSAADVWITDRSASALDVARANLAGIGRAAARVTAAEGSWYDALPADLHGTFDVIVSNPPYVAEDDQVAEDVLEWEPEEALLAGPEGLRDLTTLLTGACQWLRPGGSMVLEIGASQVGQVAALARAHFDEVEMHKDLSGMPRVLVARNPRAAGLTTG